MFITLAQPIAEPDRRNYADLRKGMYRLESMEAGRLAQIVIHRDKMDIVDFETTENDAKDFLFRIRTIITGSLISCEARDFLLIHIDNWFGSRWLGFSGKVLGALGVSMKNLTIPPFVPDRVLSVRRFFLEEKHSKFKISTEEEQIHRYQYSNENLQRQIKRLYPKCALYWYSGNTKINDRGCLMAYLPTPDGHWPWYLSLVSKPWRIDKLVEIGKEDIEHFDKALQLSK